MTTTAALHRAAEDAGRAPSILNTQPWRWHIEHDIMHLHADLSRKVAALDPHGRLLTLSCGAALHHARVALAAAGYEPMVERLPDPDQPVLLARIRVRHPRAARDDDLIAYECMRRRRTDRRPFSSAIPVAAETIAVLQAAAEAQHARLYRIDPDDVDFLRHAAQRAQAIEARDEGRAADLQAWTHRDPNQHDGVPAGTVVAHAERPVPARNFTLDGEASLAAGSGDDRCAEYLVLATEGDGVRDWLIAGEATSAVWLTATAEGLVLSPMSDVVEIPGARALIGSLIEPPGHPQLVLRAGVDLNPEPAPPSPRRPSGEVIDA